ncbi:hypothetical protein R8174_003115 [Salmonella enterica]|nr:hypothetical protein [Salmonella enterica]ELT4078153.1 hypothetical protein [Salmonella enterica]
MGRSTCMWVLGMLTSEAGGAGSGLCLVTAIGSGIVGSKIAEKMGENAGESLGKVIYNKLENSDEFIHDPDTFNEEAGRLIYEKVFDGKL